MAPYTYYYLFSVLAVLGIAFYIVNLVYLRTRGRTTFGLAYRPGTLEYARGLKLASNRNLAISALIALLFVVNLIYCIVIIVRLHTSDARWLLVFGPIAGIVTFGYASNYMSKQWKGNRSGKGH